MNITINIDNNELESYRALLQILKPVKPFSLLNNQELNTLASLIKIFTKYKHLPDKERAILALDYDNKIRICDEVGIKPSQLDNILTSLRKKGIMRNKELVKGCMLSLDKENSITYKITLNE